jgi:PIN domain nuclease of toxin-antitoxin system
VESARSELWLSSASVWELHLLAAQGKVRLGQPVDRWIEAAFQEVPIQDAPIDRRVAIESQLLPLATDDPADRFIAATARVHALVLVTSDQALIDAKGIATIPNL